ncbi:MAG: dATP/dGTP pyrophosphohydrolase domain-containing protein [Sneathiella sp.]
MVIFSDQRIEAAARAIAKTNGAEWDWELWLEEAKAALSAGAGYDIISHLHRQKAFSKKAFGPGTRAKGVVKHLRKEIDEVAENPSDISEWIDVVLLAFDGAWRQGHTPEQIALALDGKQSINEARAWPDWRGVPEDEAIEHISEEEV